MRFLQRDLFFTSKSWTNWLFLLGLLAAFFLYSQSLDMFQVGVYMDDASYVALARGLAEEGVYGYTNVPGEVNLARYPFGYPLLLAPLAKLFPENLKVFQLVSLVITLLNGCLLYAVGPQLGWRHSLVLRIFIPLLYLFSPLVSGHAIMVMSEAVFFFWVLLSLYLVILILRSDTQSIVRPLLLSAAVFMAATTRTLGYTLIVVILVAFVASKKYRQLAVFGAGLFATVAIAEAVLPVSWQDFGFSIEYGQQLRNAKQYEQIIAGDSILIRSLSLLWSYLSEGIYSVVVPIGGVGFASRVFWGKLGFGFVPSLLGLIVSCLIVVGMVRSFRECPIPLLFTVIYCGALLLWPFYLPRFLYPVFPFLCSYFLTGIEYILGAALPCFFGVFDEKREATLRVTIAAISILFLLGGTLRSLPTDSSLNHTLDLREGADWIKDNTLRDSVIMSEEPLIAFIYVNHSVVDFSSDPLDLLKQIEKYGIDYLLIRPMLKWTTPKTLELSISAQAILSYIQLRPDIFTLTYHNPMEKTYVYRVQNIRP